MLLGRTIQLENKDHSLMLRLVSVWDEANEREIELVTNNFALACATIGAIYKDRWQIELFFKCLKQNLKVKTFVGTSANALKIQIWTAVFCTINRYFHEDGK